VGRCLIVDAPLSGRTRDFSPSGVGGLGCIPPSRRLRLSRTPRVGMKTNSFPMLYLLARLGVSEAGPVPRAVCYIHVRRLRWGSEVLTFSHRAVRGISWNAVPRPESRRPFNGSRTQAKPAFGMDLGDRTKVAVVRTPNLTGQTQELLTVVWI
jgi:hypothetical protein